MCKLEPSIRPFSIDFTSIGELTSTVIMTNVISHDEYIAFLIKFGENQIML